MAILNLKRFLETLTGQNVDFVLVGGAAGMAHGMNYATDDLDICYKRSKRNYTALVKALTPCRPALRTKDGPLPFLFDEKTIHNGLNFTFQTDWGPIDLLGEVPGVGNYEAILPESVEFDFYGIKAKTISLDQLIEAKRIAGRTKDKLHLLELEAIRDLARIRK